MKNIICLKIKKILNHIIRYNNNYRISEKFSSNVFYIFCSVFVFITIVDSMTFTNVWHRWMNHLKLFGLHHLNKKCLGMKNFCIFQCNTCAKIKMTNQIFHHSLINRFTRFFYKVNIDWEALNEEWNNYQSNKKIINRIMKIVCQIKNITITYFTFIRKENENLSFIQNLIIWMFFCYSFDIKIIRSDHKMKCNWTRQYLISVDITFEPNSANKQTQNGVVERFGRMMMTKTKIMRLFINLFHSMWKKIIGATIYFYNRTSKAALRWKSSYEAFHIHIWRKEAVLGLKKSQFHRLQMYECKCYVLIKFQNDFSKGNKFRKTDFHVHIEFFVKYIFNNIYCVWISHKQKNHFCTKCHFQWTTNVKRKNDWIYHQKY